MPGRFVRRGDLLGYVIANQKAMARVLAAQDDVDLILQPTTVVQVYLARISATRSPPAFCESCRPRNRMCRASR